MGMNETGPFTETFTFKLEEDTKPKTAFSLYFSAFSASLITFGMGSIIVWTSPVVSRLRSNDTQANPLGDPITTVQESLIGSLSFIGASIGCLLLTKLCDVIGRQRTLLILATVMLMADLALAFANQIFIYYISRFVLGLCMGGGMPVAAIFLSEISENHNRGEIGTLVGLSLPLGNLYVYAIGPWFSVKVFTVLCALPYVALIISFVLFVPESPIYLASRGKRAQAIRSLEKLRAKSASEIEKEYQLIVTAWNHSKKDDKFRNFVSNKGLRRGLLIAVMANLIQQLSGVSGILAFAGPLFDTAEMSISGNMTGILIGIVKLGSVFLAMVIIERVGKRPLLLVSTFGSGSSHFVLGSFYLLRSIDVAWISYVLWLPVLSVLSYVIFYGVGLGAIVASLTSELFPSNVKSIPGALANFTNFFTCVVITSSFPVFIRSLGPAWCLWGFSICSFLGCIFVYFALPEIKGKSVAEILEILSK